MSYISNLVKRSMGYVPGVTSLCKGFVRTVSHYRKNCDPDANEPRCSEKMLKKKDCKKNAAASILLLNPECCINPCRDFLPRFDDLYYRESNKDRPYTQTWVECPRMVIRPKKICCLDRIRPPPFQKRKKSYVPPVACPVLPPSPEELKKRDKCRVQGNVKCMKVRWPGCKTAREPPRCAHMRLPTKCKKICAPFPAYSECNRPRRRPLKPSECFCVKVGPLCMYTKG